MPGQIVPYHSANPLRTAAESGDHVPGQRPHAQDDGEPGAGTTPSVPAEVLAARAPIGVVELDRDGRLTASNPAFRALVVADESALVGRRYEVRGVAEPRGHPRRMAEEIGRIQHASSLGRVRKARQTGPIITLFRWRTPA